ncbi:uncharacterized protein LOC142986326 [Anticarsia gemmatalis]|uniref:uncharacterized protein LOC142986326 n=1 Tax=Anticarsia gemmatalis TaxID=129554 RepID=UPI003F7590F8
MTRDRKQVFAAVLFTALIVLPSLNGSKVLSTSSETDDENVLKQALYLVGLLKSDYIKSLRDNNELQQDVIEESTCAENNTTPMTSIDSTLSVPTTASLPSDVSTPAPAALPGSDQPPIVPTTVAPPPSSLAPPPLLQTAAPANMPPADNPNNPYRFYRRRMVPDYYYYDAMPRFGNFRRFYNEPLYDAPPFPPANRRFGYPVPVDEALYQNRPAYGAGKFRRQGYEPSTGSPNSPMLSGNSFRRLGYNDAPFIRPGYRRAGNAEDPNSFGSIVRTQETSANMTTAPTTVAPKAEVGKQTSSPILKGSNTISKSQSSKTANKSTANRKKHKLSTISGHLKAKNNKTLLKKVRKAQKNRLQKMSTTKKPTSEDLLLSQVASELMNEIKGTENISAILSNEFNRDDDFALRQGVTKKKPVIYKSTIKIHLEGSSKMQIPFSENNAFCHLYPTSKLCSSGL